MSFKRIEAWLERIGRPARTGCPGGRPVVLVAALSLEPPNLRGPAGLSRRSEEFDRQMLCDRMSVGTIAEENASWIVIVPEGLADVTKLEAAYCPSKSKLVVSVPALAIDLSALF